MKIRSLLASEWDRLAEMIFCSTNDWYQHNLNRPCFPGDDPTVCRIFPEIYEELDPGCCLVAEIDEQLAGSCFYHPRETHIAVGIMNVNSRFAGCGIARKLLAEIITIAGRKPVRLVSSALNLDSFSLYSRAGFRPVEVYQDMVVPAGTGLPPLSSKVRPATTKDISAMVELEEEVSGIKREKDWRFFIENRSGYWHGLVFEQSGRLEGYLFSVNHPGSRMLGPGVMTSEETAAMLISAQLSHFGAESPLFLIPSRASSLVQTLYQWGARNCEIHLGQVLGTARNYQGINIPTFMPETG